MSGRIVHFELPYDDGERARSFYGKLFGWDIQSYPGMEYSMVSTGPSGDQGPTEPGYINGGMGPRGESLTGPTVVVDVGDIEATLRQVEEEGGTVLAAKRPVGQMGWTAYFRDTEGNVVGLWETSHEGS
ncbi:VOC family protein [Pedococcus sp. 5OH_020]|uniref:VOC family protein n=1 Tax=Pedococcus sp. 5OH_020 TaxID=2989814 RepID=UPI0022E9EC92|nr:VOC family protein [Pedococcus sp. 5OH_020]